MIKVKTMLAEIDQLAGIGGGVTFSLDYVRQNGTLGRKVRLMKGGSSGGSDYVPVENGRGFGYNLKERGLLLVVDMETGQPRSIKIRRITHYNNVRVLHGAGA